MRVYMIFALLAMISALPVAADEDSTTTNEAPTTTPTPTPASEPAPTPTSAPETPASEIPSVVTKSIKRLIKDPNKASVEPAPIAGLYEVMVGADVFYVSADGRYLLMGDIREAKTGKNITDNKREQFRREVLNTFDEEKMIVFAPEKETKHTINVFTDVDCPYCAKFHNEVPKLNEAGIKVRYLAFPRAGVGSKTYKTMVSVWCAKDQQQALTDAKARKEIEPAECDNPVEEQYELGQRIGINGTPAMVLSNGELVPGYVPAPRLISFLDKKEGKKEKN